MGSTQQEPNLAVTFNSTLSGVANYNIKVRRSKAMDIKFHWVKDRKKQKKTVGTTKK